MATRSASKRAPKKDGGVADAGDNLPAAERRELTGEKPAKRPRIQSAVAGTNTGRKAPHRGKQGLDAGSENKAGLGSHREDHEPADADSSGDAVEAGTSEDDDDGHVMKGKAKGKGKARTKAGPKAGAEASGPREPPGPRYFLMKSEPDEFSLDELAAKPNQTSHWEGVRNFQARNIMRSMRLGDQAFFYHSSCKVPAVVGVVRVVREAYPDHFAFDKTSKYYDPSSTPESPRWWMVDVQLERRMARPVTLAELRQEGARGPPIQDMVLINKSRLSVQPVTAEQWHRILKLEQQLADEKDEGAQHEGAQIAGEKNGSSGNGGGGRSKKRK